MRADERGAAVVETILVLPLLIALLMATVALASAAVAKAVVVNAVRDSARVVSIECGQGDASWYGDALAAARGALAGVLPLGARVAEPLRPGQWSFAASCAVPGVPGPPAAVVIRYAAANLFPPLAPLLEPGSRAGPAAFLLTERAVFPEE